MSRPFTPRTITLRSADSRDFLRLSALRRDAGYPSLEVRVEGTAKGFAGGSDVWIDGFALKEFVGALRSFEQSRQRRVELRALEADALRIVLRSDGPGSLLLAEFEISRNALVGGAHENVALRVSGAFELDPRTLGEILGGFTQLANAVAS